MEERLRKACSQRTYSAGGLNIPQFKVKLIELFSNYGIDKSIEINSTNSRTDLYRFCRELDELIVNRGAPVNNVVQPHVNNVVQPLVNNVVQPPVNNVVQPPVNNVVQPPVNNVVQPPVNNVVNPNDDDVPFEIEQLKNTTFNGHKITSPHGFIFIGKINNDYYRGYAMYQNNNYVFATWINGKLHGKVIYYNDIDKKKYEYFFLHSYKQRNQEVFNEKDNLIPFELYSIKNVSFAGGRRDYVGRLKMKDTGAILDIVISNNITTGSVIYPDNEFFDGSTIIGKWINGKLHGKVIYNTPNNNPREYYFKYGMYVGNNLGCKSLDSYLDNTELLTDNIDPNIKTETSYYCQYIGNICKEQLVKILEQSGILMINEVPVSQLTKNQICNFLSNDYEQYLITLDPERIPDDKKIPVDYCNQNDTTLGGDDFNEVNIDRIIRDENGYCFTIEDIANLKDNKNPYTRMPFSDEFIDTYKDKSKNYIGIRHLDKDLTLNWNRLVEVFKLHYEYSGHQINIIRQNSYDRLIDYHGYLCIFSNYAEYIYQNIQIPTKKGTADQKKLFYLSQYIDFIEKDMRPAIIKEFCDLFNDHYLIF